MLLLLLLLLAPQAEAERLFTLGNTLASEGDVRGAVAAYEGATATGWTSPELEVNLSLAYFESGRRGHAMLHAERAHRLAPNHEAVQRNLRLLREQLGTAPTALSPDESAARWLSANLGASGVTALLLVLWTAVLGLIGVRLWLGTSPPWLRRSLVVLTPLSVFVALAALLTARYEATPRAVALTEVTMRSTPSNAASRLGDVDEGTVLSVTEQRGTWRAVRLPDGSEGWIEAPAVEEI